MPTPFSTFQDFMDGARRGAPLTNSVGRVPMTRMRLQSLILQGFGQGRGDAYSPWIRVSRANAPRKSNHYVAIVSCQTAPLHLLSALEYAAARVASWLGAEEIRSQFPLFPWCGHPHPLAGLDAKVDALLPRTKGLLTIAQEAGIKHGTYVGAPDVPYVATTDLLISRGHSKTQQLVFWTVKPAELLHRAKPGSRMIQRIELERLYAVALGAKHVIYDGTQVNDRLIANLDWLEPPGVERTDPQQALFRSRFVESFQLESSDVSLADRIERAGNRSGLETPEAQRHWRAAAWLGLLDIDLTQPILMSRPMTTGGTASKRALCEKLMGEVQ